jgi:hypothetical protein
MRRNIRTKKNRKHRKKNKSFKTDAFKADVGVSVSVGGGTEDVPDTNTNAGVNELTKNIEDAHSLSNFLPDLSLSNFSLGSSSLGDSKVINKITELSEGLAIKSIDKTANFFDVDLNDSEQFRKRLEELKVVLDSPENKELMREVMANFAQVGIVALDASKPFIDDLITEIFAKLEVVGNEFGEAGVKIALNTLTEIPGYGVIIGTIRSVSNAAEAVLASSNAFSEIVTTTSDTINASVQNFDKLLKEKGDLIDRTTESINKFSENMKSMPNSVSTPATTPISAVPSGGTRKHKKNNNKSKKVRFNL